MMDIENVGKEYGISTLYQDTRISFDDLIRNPGHAKAYRPSVGNLPILEDR